MKKKDKSNSYKPLKSSSYGMLYYTYFNPTFAFENPHKPFKLNNIISTNSYTSSNINMDIINYDEFSIKDNYHITINILNSCAIAYSAIIGILIMIFVIRLLKNLSHNIKVSGNRINNAFCFIKVKYFKLNN